MLQHLQSLVPTITLGTVAALVLIAPGCDVEDVEDVVDDPVSERAAPGMLCGSLCKLQLSTCVDDCPAPALMQCLDACDEARGDVGECYAACFDGLMCGSTCGGTYATCMDGCDSPQCYFDTDCGWNSVCVNHACESGCRVDSECPGSDNVCIDGRCWML